jgi:hypothetical protein
MLFEVCWGYVFSLALPQKEITYHRKRSPSTVFLIKFADVFGVTLNFLDFAVKGQIAKLNIQDRELLKKVELLDSLSVEEKGLAKEILDFVILKHKFQKLAATGGTH